jgi:hypothetical protein
MAVGVPGHDEEDMCEGSEPSGVVSSVVEALESARNGK